MSQINIGLIGCGGITLANHLPGLALCSETRVTAVCDTNPATLENARKQTGAAFASTHPEDLLQRDDVDAVIIATPNISHAPLTLAAVKHGKHVLCEKPIAMTYSESLAMFRAAEAAQVRHMTAFTYRFVPAMRYMAHLVKQGYIGKPYHVRTCRLQDWGDRAIGWRQNAELAGSGEIGDMLSHRIDYAHLLFGQMTEVIADTRRFLDTREGQVSTLEDWVAMLAKFESHATGVLESSKVASGRGEGGKSPDYCEVNGSEGTLVYYLDRPHELWGAQKKDPGLKTVAVPRDFQTWPGSKRDPNAGDPVVTFRYDQNVEFVEAIREGRPCSPSFADGVRAQAVMEAALTSVQTKSWVGVEKF